MRKKAFDCVEMMHRAAQRIYRETKGMTRAEELAYWRGKEAALRVGQRPRRSKKSAAAVAEPAASYRAWPRTSS
jgi:hypothetical protein